MVWLVFKFQWKIKREREGGTMFFLCWIVPMRQSQHGGEYVSRFLYIAGLNFNHFMTWRWRESVPFCFLIASRLQNRCEWNL